jgi:hypothetical protein
MVYVGFGNVHLKKPLKISERCMWCMWCTLFLFIRRKKERREEAARPEDVGTCREAWCGG